MKPALLGFEKKKILLHQQKNHREFCIGLAMCLMRNDDDDGHNTPRTNPNTRTNQPPWTDEAGPSRCCRAALPSPPSSLTDRG